MRNSAQSDDRKPSILVWGGLGFLGQHLVSRLVALDNEVTVLCRSRSLYRLPEWSTRVRWIELDHGGSLERTLLSAVSGASLIYNFAGASGAAASNRNPIESLDQNCRVQLLFLSACRRAGHRPHVVFPSSWLVYAPGNAQPVGEDHPTAPLSMYAAHKLCIENYLRIFAGQDLITYTVCRISNPYGIDPSRPKRDYKILISFIEKALSKSPITLFGDGRQLRDFIYIDDVIEAILLAGFNAEAQNQILNVGSGASYSLLEAVETVFEIAGPAPLQFCPWPEEYLAVEPGDYVADISRIVTKLGFRPRFDLKAGLQETVRLCLQNTTAAAHSSGAR